MTAVPTKNGVALSTLDTLIAQHATTFPSNSDALHALAVQVLHNLEHQHAWTQLAIHTKPDALLPRPMISGLPPRRVYVHPDEQIEHIRRGLKEEDLAPQREWVLPTRLTERSWTLDSLARVFDAIDVVPPQPTATGTARYFIEDEAESSDRNARSRTELDDDLESRWRTMKRLLLATVDDDSTVVYYVVHDGVVKPRQN